MTDLRNFFLDGVQLRDVTSNDAEKLKTHYLERGLAANTIARRLRTVRMFFKAAHARKLVSENPFAAVSHHSTNPDERRHYVTRDDARKLIDAATPQWRVLVALARFAGLRTPNEPFSLKWSHVNFETSRMTVPSSKRSAAEKPTASCQSSRTCARTWKRLSSLRPTVPSTSWETPLLTATGRWRKRVGRVGTR